MFSVSNNAVQDSFTDPRGNKGLDLHDYQQRRDYVVIGNQCREQPERGSIQDRIPDLRRVTYNKTDTFNGQQVYVWNDSQGGRGPRGIEYLTTADANEYPVAFTDFNNQRVKWRPACKPSPRRPLTALPFRRFADVYSAFTPVTTWPAGSFSKPAGCQ
jgi:hypothetical protein